MTKNVILLICYTGVVLAAAVGTLHLAAQAPAPIEPERWEDPDYPVVCYRFPGDVSASCVVVPTEDAVEDLGWVEGTYGA